MFLVDTLQIRVLRQDGSPITGTKQSVIIHTYITSPVSKLQPTPYYWGPQTTTFQLNNQILSLSDTGLVEVKIEIPKNASKVNLRVCLKNVFLESGHFFNSHELKTQVSFSDHLSSVVRLSVHMSVNFSHFYLQNHWANLTKLSKEMITK